MCLTQEEAARPPLDSGTGLWSLGLDSAPELHHVVVVAPLLLSACHSRVVSSMDAWILNCLGRFGGVLSRTCRCFKQFKYVDCRVGGVFVNGVLVRADDTLLPQVTRYFVQRLWPGVRVCVSCPRTTLGRSEMWIVFSRYFLSFVLLLPFSQWMHTVLGQAAINTIALNVATDLASLALSPVAVSF